MLFKHSWLPLALYGALWLPALGCGGSNASPPPSADEAAKTPPLTLPPENGTLNNPAPP